MRRDPLLNAVSFAACIHHWMEGGGESVTDRTLPSPQIELERRGEIKVLPHGTDPTRLVHTFVPRRPPVLRIQRVLWHPEHPSQHYALTLTEEDPPVTVRLDDFGDMVAMLRLLVAQIQPDLEPSGEE